jgi:CheY-like chemotaxis protein
MFDKTIIIVEDEIELRENLTDLLEFKDYNVVVYDSGTQLLENLDSIKAGMIFIDFQMPGLTGTETAAKVKEKYPKLPIVLVTASSQPSTREEAEKAGIDKLIIKPYSPDDIFDTVAEFLPYE